MIVVIYVSLACVFVFGVAYCGWCWLSYELRNAYRYEPPMTPLIYERDDMEILLNLASVDGPVEMDFLYAGRLKLAVHQCNESLAATWTFYSCYLAPECAEHFLVDLFHHIRQTRRLDACRLFHVEAEAECQED